MKRIQILGITLLFCLLNVPIYSEDVHYGDYTIPGVISPDLVIIGGNLDLKDSCTVEGDLKIIGGYISVASDNSSTKTVDLYVNGDLIITNTNVIGTQNADITIPTGRLIVAGEIFTRSENSSAWISSGYGIEAGRIETSGAGDAYIVTLTGSITVEEDIVTRSADDARVQAGTRYATPTESYDIKAASITTHGDGVASAYVEADGSIDVRGAIVTRAPNGSAYVRAAQYYAGGIRAGSILTNGYGDAYVYSGILETRAGYINVAQDIVTTSSTEHAYIAAGDSFIEANNIIAHGQKDAYVRADTYIDARGDVRTESLSSSNEGQIQAVSGMLKAKGIATKGGSRASVSGGTGIDVFGEISTESSSTGDISVSSANGDVKAGSIRTNANSGNGNVTTPSGSILVDHTISTSSDQGDAYVYATGGNLEVGSVLTYAALGNAYVRSDSEIIVKDLIETYGGTSGYVRSSNDTTSRSIKAYGGTAYILSSLGSIEVVEDIQTTATTGAGYVQANNGSIVAQKIQTAAPTGQDDYISSAAGSGTFEFVPTKDDVTITIKDAEFGLDNDHQWNTILSIEGTCTFNGNGHQLTFESGGGITVTDGAKLLLRNIKLEEVEGEAVKCLGTGTIWMDNVLWSQSDDCSFNNGSINVVSKFAIEGAGHQFNYQSSTVSNIRTDAMFTVGRGVTFNYNVGSSGNIAMANGTSRFHFDGSTLNAQQSIRLTTGVLVLDNNVTFNAEAGTTISLVAGSLTRENRVGADLSLTGDGTFGNA